MSLDSLAAYYLQQVAPSRLTGPIVEMPVGTVALYRADLPTPGQNDQPFTNAQPLDFGGDARGSDGTLTTSGAPGSIVRSNYLLGSDARQRFDVFFTLIDAGPGTGDASLALCSIGAEDDLDSYAKITVSADAPGQRSLVFSIFDKGASGGVSAKLPAGLGMTGVHTFRIRVNPDTAFATLMHVPTQTIVNAFLPTYSWTGKLCVALGGAYRGLQGTSGNRTPRGAEKFAEARSLGMAVVQRSTLTSESDDVASILIGSYRHPTITLSPATATAQVGGAPIAFNVTLANSTANPVLTLEGPGTLSIDGLTVTYTPPATASSTSTVRIRAQALGGTSFESFVTLRAASVSEPTPTLSALNLRADPNFTSSKLGNIGTPLRDWYEQARLGWVFLPDSQRKDKVADTLKWKPEYANQYVVKSYGGKSYRYYTGPNCGSYFLGRKIGTLYHSLVSFGLRASKDLTYLDVACEEARHFLDQLDDQGGISSPNPDGYLSVVFGVNGHNQLWFGTGDPRNTAIVDDAGGGATRIRYADDMGSNSFSSGPATGTDRQIEDGLMLSGPMVAALGAHYNADLYSPQFEPIGNRPSKPQFYAKLRDDACKFWEDMRAKWLADETDGKKKQLPFAVREDLAHSFLNEMCSYVCYAKIKGGADWKNHWAYLEAARGWKMMFGPLEKVGNGTNPDLKCCWYETNVPGIGACVVFTHRVKRFTMGNGKDETGEYVTTNTGTGPHLNDYTAHSVASILFMHLEDCDFVPKEFVQGLANTYNSALNRNPRSASKSYLGNRATRLSYPMDAFGDGGIVPPATWKQTSGNRGSDDGQLVNSTQMGLAAFDTNNELPEYFAGLFSALSATDKKQIHAATAMQMLNAAYRAAQP